MASPTITTALGLLALALAPRAPLPVPAAQEPPRSGEQAGGSNPRPLTRERLLRYLEAISEAARLLEELAESDESRGLAERIRWLSRSLVEDLGSPPPAPAAAASDAPAEEPAPADGPPAVETGSGELPEGPWVDPEETGARGALTQRRGSAGFNLVADDLLTARNLALSNGTGNAVTNTHYEGTGGRPVRWSNVHVYALPDPRTGVESVKWGMIGYDARDWVFERCTFSDVKVEHGQYVTCLGGLRWDHCLFTDIGSQGLQLVGAVPGTAREKQTAFRGAGWWSQHDKHKWEWVEVLDSAFLEVGKPTGARPSFAFSGFDGPLNPVRIARCVFRTTQSRRQDANGVGRDCYGAVMAHNRLRVELLDTYVEYRRGDRDVVQLWYNSDGVEDTVDVVIRGCTILSDTQKIDIRVAPGDTVVLEGNAGTAQVLVSSNPKYVWANSPRWDRSKVIYEGPISSDYRLD